MTGFHSKRQETLDYLQTEDEALTKMEMQWLVHEANLRIRRELISAAFMMIGSMGAAGATGFYFGIMYATGRVF
jgi:hypothetical protein